MSAQRTSRQDKTHSDQSSLIDVGGFKSTNDSGEEHSILHTNRVAVIIINYNAGDMLQECLAALGSQTVQPSRVLVMDNGSHDKSIDRCQADFPQVEFHRLNANLGFARANNLAVHLASDCHWLALLNPDAFPDPRWIQTLIEGTVRYPDVDAFASCMIQANRSQLLDGAGDAYRVDGVAWPRFQGEPLSQLPLDDHDVFSPCGGAAFYRRSAFLEAGGFSERYFCYHEDVDLGFRLRLAGSRCLFLRNALVRHAGSAISGGQDSDFSIYHAHRNMIWTYFRNMPAPYFWVYLPAHLLANVVSLLWFICCRRRLVMWHAKRDAVKALHDIWRERRRIQTWRRVSPSAVVRAMEQGTLMSSVLRKIIMHSRRLLSSKGPA